MNNTNLTSAPLVTIGLPVYNGGKYLRLALDSLLAQTFKDFKLVVSDNASIDDTENICREYARTDSRIKYFRQESNLGASGNFHFVKAQGTQSKYFMWAAHDDIWESNWLEVLINEFTEDDLALRGRAINIDGAGQYIGETFVTSFSKGQVLKVFMDNEKNCRALYWYALFNNEILHKVNLNLLDSTYGVDTLFIIHLVEFGALRVTNKTSQYYRRHDASETNIMAKDFFAHRVLYYLFPISTYIYSVKVVDMKYKLLIILAIPFKLIKSQFNIWPRIIKLIFTGGRF